MAHTIEKIKVFKPDRQGVIDSGELVVEGDTLEFRGKKGTLQLSPVREVAADEGVVRIDFGEGEAMRSVMIGDFRRGTIRTRSQNKVLVTELRSLLNLKELTEQEQGVARGRSTGEAVAAYRRGRVRMWIGGIGVVGGGIATAIGYAVASDSGGGTYFVFWGAMLFGALLFIQGMADVMKHRGVAAPVVRSAKAKIPSGASIDIERLRADGDVDGLVEALWVNEFDVRAKAMDALAELKDPAVTDRVISALGHSRWDVRWSAAETLGKLGDPRAIEPLRGVLGDEQAFVRAAAEQSIKALEGGSA